MFLVESVRNGSGFGWKSLSFLVLLHRQLDEVQMGGTEAGQSLVRPGGWIGGVLLVGALLDLGTRLGGITVLAQLLDEMFDVEACGVVEQTHLGEDALDVRVSLLIVGEVPCLVLSHLFFGDSDGGHTLSTVLDKVFVCLDLPIIGIDLMEKAIGLYKDSI